MYVAKYYVCVLSKPNLNKYIILILIGTIQSSSDDDNNDNCQVLSNIISTKMYLKNLKQNNIYYSVLT